MRSVVCVKRVPDTAVDVKVAAGGKSVDTSGIEPILNPYDEYALESALRLKDAAGAGEVTVLSLGPGEATKEVRKGLAMGADKGVLLKAADTGKDALSVAKTLVATLEGLSFDVLFFGARAVDTDDFQVGPMVADLLKLPFAGEVVEVVKGADGRIVATREQEGGHAKIALRTPCAVSFQKGVHEPRPATLPGIMKAKKKPLEDKDATVAPSRLEVLSVELPAKRPPGKIVGKGPDAVPELVRLLREEAKVL